MTDSPTDVQRHDTGDEAAAPDSSSGGWSQWWRSEDWWAIWIGGALLAICLAAVLANEGPFKGEYTSPLKPWLGKPGTWSANNFIASDGESGAVGQLIDSCVATLPKLVGVLIASLLGFGAATAAMGTRTNAFVNGFVFVFALATLAYLLAAEEVIKYYNLSYALWALAVGLLISNTIGTPAWAKPALRTELYIKTGLVLLGAEVLFSKLLTLGVPGICVAWIVTPVVLITTFWFGQKILRIASPSLNMVVSADMSVCGVSAAIATAAACRAKKEELSLAIGMSLTFTVVMMVLMPIVIEATGMSNVLGGAWMGGTIDATGAVAAAGAILGDDALQVAATVKMIQNILIGVIAFCVAVYWVLRVEEQNGGAKPSVLEIWRRFPKFILGFVAASILFSLLYSGTTDGRAIVDATITGSTKTLRGWFFCLAFVSIGLETNFRELAGQLSGGKPLVLYVCGQSLNLCLTLLMAWLMFEKVFPEATRVLQQ